MLNIRANLYYLFEQKCQLEKSLAAVKRHIKLLEDDIASCKHEHTYTEESTDYHTNTEWVYTYCSDCGAEISKK